MQEITAVSRKNLNDLTDFHHNDWDNIFKQVENGDRKVFVIKDSGAICGYVSLNFSPRYALFGRLNIPEIQDLFICPNFRRRGFAHLLLDHCEDIARQLNYTQIGISVSVSPKFGLAQRLYINRGYNFDGNGVTCDREPVAHGAVHKIEDDLCLMLMRDL